MSDDLKRIDINHVRVGMYLEDVFSDDGLLLLSANTSVDSVSQIEKLKKQGVRSVFINTQKGDDVRTDPGAQTRIDAIAEKKREAAYYEELTRAKDVHQKAVETAHDVLSSIRKGRPLSTVKIEKLAEEIVDSILRNPDALVSLVQIKGYDEYTYVHSVNVGVLVTSLANSLGYGPQKLFEAGVGGLLHDIGKMRVPEHILNTPGKLTEPEFIIMKRHPAYGLEIVNDRKNVSAVSKAAIIEHHERYNGRGYPKGLTGDLISEIGLITSIADVYDALTSDRVYRAAWTPQKTLALIFQGADIDYSRNMVEKFTKLLGIYPVGSFVQLKSKELGVVTRIDKGNLLAPVVLVLFDAHSRRLENPVEYELSRKLADENGEQFKIMVSLNPKAYNVDVGEYISSKPL